MLRSCLFIGVCFVHFVFGSAQGSCAEECGPDEVPWDCDNDGSGIWYCSQTETSSPLLEDGTCFEGCRCKDGLLRTENGDCVPEEQCPTPHCDDNEVYDVCPPQYPPQRCDADPNTITCTDNPKPGDSSCKPGCRCVDNYLRNEHEICVPKDQCDSSSCQNNDLNLKKFEQGNVAFTEKFLYESAISNPGVSIIASPFSVLFLLLQLALYSTGLAKEQLSSLLKLDTKPDIRCFVPNYLDTLNSQQNVTFSLVEKVYGNDQYPFTADFGKDTKDIFKAESENLDFCKSQQAADTINNDVAKATNNLIKDLVSPDMLSCDTVVVLTNAIYFKGIWKKKFEKKNTQKENFYVNNEKTVKVDMMKQTESFKYTELSDPPAQVLEIPYESDNFSFMIWLPKSKDGINDMLDKLKDKKFTLSGAVDGLRSRKVDLSLPTINVSTKTDLKDILLKNNQTAIFNPSRSGLTGIIKSSQPIYVSSAVQKATMVLNEEGSKAAAGNAMVVSITSVVDEPNTQFIANRPYIYCILYKRTPIFCGIYYGPN